MIKRYFVFLLIALFLHSLLYFFPFFNIKKDDTSQKDKQSQIKTFKMVDLPVQKKIIPPVVKKSITTSPKKNAVPQKKESVLLPISEPVPQEEPESHAQTDTTTDSLPESTVTENTPEEKYFKASEVSVMPSLPVRLLRQRLQYPQDARRRGIEGVVYLQLYINSQGIVEKVEILHEKPDASYGFGSAAKNALLGLKGTPAKIGKNAVGVIFRYPVRFSLEK